MAVIIERHIIRSRDRIEIIVIIIVLHSHGNHVGPKLTVQRRCKIIHDLPRVGKLPDN